ncbi:MAG: hypothetical protein AAF688_08125 [Bacteroidota bacterium]
MLKKITLIIFLCTVSLNYAQVGIGTTEPKSTLDVNGNVAFKVNRLDGNVNTTIDDGYYINILPNTGGQTFTLPNPGDVSGRTYILRNVVPSGSNNAVINAQNGGCVFFANNSQGCSNSFSLDAFGKQKTIYLYSDGIGWNYAPIGFN